jgi:hypothetical protein
MFIQLRIITKHYIYVQFKQCVHCSHIVQIVRVVGHFSMPTSVVWSLVDLFGTASLGAAGVTLAILTAAARPARTVLAPTFGGTAALAASFCTRPLRTLARRATLAAAHSTLGGAAALDATLRTLVLGALARRPAHAAIPSTASCLGSLVTATASSMGMSV